MIKWLVYVMFYLYSEDTRIGMTYKSVRDIQLGNELYEKQMQVYELIYIIENYTWKYGD